MPNDLFNTFRSFFRALRTYNWWQVAVEMLLIGLVVYWVVRFLRGTRGARMLRGIAFVLIAGYLIVRLLASQFGLDRIAFLYERFLLFAGFAITVAFQPELRRALMALGETSLFRARAQQIDEEIEALVEAATFLSRRKIGAVVAIEREVGLGGIAESGTKLDADLSADLLDTIFWPNSPLHDLGVVVSRRPDRCTPACSSRWPRAATWSGNWAAGHRAAVGMSQESDAVVLVVSEETGDVSIAERGAADPQAHARGPARPVRGTALARRQPPVPPGRVK